MRPSLEASDMIATQSTTHEYLSQETRANVIASLHEQLSGSFASFSQIQQVQWYDSGLEPAYLHHLFDQLSEEVSLLISGLDIEDHEMALTRVGENDPVKKNYHRLKTMTTLVDRYSILIDTLRAAAQASAEDKDWGLSNICSEFALQFDESLWFMAIYLHENLSDYH
jgi:DNA-binding ferritin-like protein